MKNKYLAIIAALVMVNLMLVWQVYAGSPDSPNMPDATWSYTLEDIYRRLSSGEPGAQSTFTEPGAGPGTGTWHTVNEIMGVAPAADNMNGATTADVRSGKTFWGLKTGSGQWGQRTGTVTDGSDVYGADGSKTFNIPDGFYSGKTATANDSDLIAGNIKSGVTIFGVSGSAVVASGNATDGDVLAGRTYSNDSGASTGTMPNNGAVTIVPTTTNQPIVTGYHNGSGYVPGDPELVAGNIKLGVNLFGVDGALTGDAGVPKTGQTVSYSTGDDGHLEKGVAWPNPRFTGNGDGTVTDNLTGLIWLFNADCFGLEKWQQALAAANALNSGECGLNDGSVEGDWRLPNVRELQSLVHYGFYDPALSDDAGTRKWGMGPSSFTRVRSNRYWSSTTYDRLTNYAWHVNMNRGHVGTYSKNGDTYYVWPVRGGD